MEQARNEEGMALVLCLAEQFRAVLGLLGGVVATFSTAGQRSASHSSAGVAAYSLAEAGINNAVSVLAAEQRAQCKPADRAPWRRRT